MKAIITVIHLTSSNFVVLGAGKSRRLVVWYWLMIGLDWRRKLYNENEHSFEWVNLNINQILTSRQTNFLIMKTNNNKVGLNILTNRLHILNGKIPLSWLNLTLSTFKVKCKQLLLGI